jgi:hypothetical protein
MGTARVWIPACAGMTEKDGMTERRGMYDEKGRNDNPFCYSQHYVIPAKAGIQKGTQE